MTRALNRPDAEQGRLVEALAACGAGEADIAQVVGISLDQLRAHHRDELETGAILANAKVAENLLQTALGDSPQAVAAAIFWLKNRAGWSEKAATAQHEPVTDITVRIVSPDGSVREKKREPHLKPVAVRVSE